MHDKLVEGNGGSSNGSTHPDYTDYFEILPSNKMAVGLWLESDRMRSLAITEENLTNQKEAVKAERRNSFDNRPYQTAVIDVWPTLAFQNWQSSHSLIGSFEDLNASSVADVSKFFKTYYAPNNAILCIVGDIRIPEAKKWIEAYFADIPAQPQPKRPDLTEPADFTPRTEVYKDTQAKVPAVLIGWPGPARRSPDYNALVMIDALLTGGDSSRFRQNLVKGKQSVLSYDANPGWPFAGASDYKDPAMYAMSVMYHPKFTAKEIVGQIQDEVAQLQKEPVSMKELERERTFLRAARIKELQSALGRARLLAQYEMFDGKPELITSELDSFLAVTPEQVQAVAKKYLIPEKRSVLEIAPAPEGEEMRRDAGLLAGAIFVGATLLSAQVIDRKKPPQTPPLPAYHLPPVFETKLSNGLAMVLIEDPRFPLVTVRLAFDGGSRADPSDLRGLAEAAGSLLTEGTRRRTSRQISDEAATIGGSVGAQSSPDALIVSGSALSEHAPELLDLVADVARNATFPAGEVELYKQNRLQGLLQQSSRKRNSWRPRSFTKSYSARIRTAMSARTAESIGKVDIPALEKFRDSYLAPNNAALIVLGRLPARAALLKLLQQKFGDWEKHAIPALPTASIPSARKSITLVDRPGSVQADVHIGHVAVTRSSPDYFPLMVGSTILGGGASSRLFAEIREKQGFAYSVYSHALPMKESGMFSAVMQVRNEVLGPAIGSMLGVALSGMA